MAGRPSGRSLESRSVFHSAPAARAATTMTAKPRNPTKKKTAPAAPRVVGVSTSVKGESQTVADRWSDALVVGIEGERGFVPVVRTFLRNYSELNPPLSIGEALFVIHLMDFKRGANAPYPGYTRLAKFMGVTPKMARRYAQSLETKKYLIRQYRVAQTNKFDLRPLVRALENHLQGKKRPGRVERPAASAAS